jgi:pilus assembly protein CpaD
VIEIMTRTGRLSLFTAGLLASASLAACAQDPAKAALEPRTPTEQWTQQVHASSQPDEVRLAPHRSGLSGNQNAALGSLMARWIEADGPEILISAPTGGADPQAAYAVATQTRDFLIENGAPQGSVRIASYPAAGDPVAPVIVGYLRYQADIPRCGEKWDNLTATNENKPFANFGCAVTANMAAQVANPADLDHPRASTPVDASRRSVIVGKYQKGDATASAKDPNSSGVVSKAVD